MEDNSELVWGWNDSDDTFCLRHLKRAHREFNARYSDDEQCSLSHFIDVAHFVEKNGIPCTHCYQSNKHLQGGFRAVVGEMKVYTTPSLPAHWIIEDQAGQLWMQPTANNGPQHRKPYNGHRVGLVEVTGIQQRRIALGLSQSEMAAALGISIDTLQGWESGRRQPRMRGMVDKAIERLETDRKEG